MTDEASLHTERLSLRWFQPGDAHLLLALWNDPAFIQNVGDRGIRTLEQAKDALANGPMKLYAEHGYGPYRVALTHGDKPIGLCGLFKREYLDDPDIGFALLPDYWGKGFAFEAAVAVMDHARDGLGLNRVTAIVSPGNTASVQLLEKLGLHFEGMVIPTGEDKELLLYSADREAAG